MRFISAILVGLFRLFKTILRLFPLGTPPALGRFLGRIIGRLFPRDRSIAKTHIDYVRAYLSKNGAAKSFPDSERLVDAVFAHAGESVGEVMIIDRLLARDKSASGFRYVDSTGQEIVREMLDAGRGGVALSGHLGCFELLAAFHAAYGAPISVIGRDPNYESLGILLRDLRASYGVETVWRDDPATARKLIGALKTGRVVAVLIDQDTALENSFSPFFGIDAAYPVGPMRLAIKQRLPIISTFIAREKSLQHHVFTRRIDYDPDDPQAIEKILAAFGAHLEELIIRFPEQWLWWHRRWRRRPGVNYKEHPDQLPSTENYLRWISAQSA